MRSGIARLALAATPRVASAASASVAPASAKAIVLPEHYDASLNTLAARIQLKPADLQTLKQGLTHKSFHHGALPHNERLAVLGHSMLRFIVIEHLYNKYPKLPADALENALEMYIGPKSSAQIVRSLGVDQCILWTPAGEKAEQSENKVFFTALRGLIGAIYHESGTVGVKTFVHAYVLSRTIDAGAALSLGEPKRLLSALLKRQGRQAAQSRIIKETGRTSHASMFLVGVYSGEEQLATGSGQSIKVAETVAAKNALQQHFLKVLENPLAITEESIASAAPQDTPPIV